MLPKFIRVLSIGCTAAFFSSVFAANSSLSTPTADFSDNGDGTVTHKKTGLTWQRCSVGQTWTGTTCEGMSSKFSHDQALTGISNSFAGKDDWRIPRIDELSSIVEYGKYSPAINIAIFPNTSPEQVWSSTASNRAWYVNFTHGNFTDDTKNQNYAVRLVRGGQPLVESGEFTPTADFTDNNDGTVIHKKTGLTWQRCSVGQTWTGTTCEGMSSNFSHTEAIRLSSEFAGKKDWRLPTQNELVSIVEFKIAKDVSDDANTTMTDMINGNYSSTTDKQSVFNSNVFPNTPYFLNKFWSSSIPIANPLGAWYINANYGTSAHAFATASMSVRLVRSEIIAILPTNVDLNATLVASPSPAKVNQDLSYSATVTNKGTTEASDVKIRFSIPSTIKFVSTPNQDCVFKELGVTCSIISLSANTSISRSIIVNIAKAGAVSFAVTAKSAETDANPKDNRASTVTAIKK